MAEVTVKQFADVLSVSPERLLVQLDEAGIRITDTDAVINDEQKMELLTHLRQTHGKGSVSEAEPGPRKITLKRRSVSELKVASGKGQAKTVSVEVRKKRTYVKRSVVMEEEQRRVDEITRQREAEDQERLAREQAEEAVRKQTQDEQRRKQEEEDNKLKEADETRRKELEDEQIGRAHV